MHIKVKVVLEHMQKSALYSHSQRVRTAIVTMNGNGYTCKNYLNEQSHIQWFSQLTLGYTGSKIQRLCTGCKEKNSSIDVPSCGQDWKQLEYHESKW